MKDRNAPDGLIADWYQAFLAEDVPRILDLYAADAGFIGTSSSEFTHAPTALRDYFVRAMLDWHPTEANLLRSSTRELGPDTAVVMGLDRIRWRDPASPRISHGRVTFVLRKTAGAWKIAHFHRSEVPATIAGGD